jgi:large subunit ribosomal protein L14
MKGVKAKVTRGLPVGSRIPTADNSGAKIVRLVSVKSQKTVKGKIGSAGVGDFVMATVVKGTPEMRNKVVFAVIIRQRKEFRRADGTRVSFEDNAAVVLKDDKGNPKGTLIKGAVAKEACERWPGIAKLASVIV